MGERYKAMGNHVDWSELERTGKLPAQPEREKAVAAALAKTAARKAAKLRDKPASNAQ